MVLLFFLAVNAGVALVFFRYQKNHLHVFERFLYWCSGSLIVQIYSAIQTMNTKSSVVPDVMGAELAHLLNRTVLYPILTMMFLNRIAAARSLGGMAIWLVVFTAGIAGVEAFASLSGVFVHVTWTIGQSAAFWLCDLVISAGFMKIFRTMLRAEGVNS